MRITEKCLSCDHKDAHYVLCDVCGITQDGNREYYKSKPNDRADWVRRMDYGALALLLSDVSDGYLGPVSKDICADCEQTDCTPCWELWLRQEASNG